MDHIKRKNNPAAASPDVFSLVPKPPKQEGALILYKPLPVLTALSEPDSKKEPERIPSSLGLDISFGPPTNASQDDAMDIDP